MASVETILDSEVLYYGDNGHNIKMLDWKNNQACSFICMVKSCYMCTVSNYYFFIHCYQFCRPPKNPQNPQEIRKFIRTAIVLLIMKHNLLMFNYNQMVVLLPIFIFIHVFKKYCPFLSLHIK